MCSAGANKSMIPPGITAAHVKAAIEKLGKTTIPASKLSRSWFMEFGGNRFPPKLVVSTAAEIATGKPLLHREFNSGGPSGARALLTRLGFSVVAGALGTDEEDDPFDPEDVEQLLKEWLPDEKDRLTCATLFADAVELIHQIGDDKWRCYFADRKRFSLNVGSNFALRIQKENAIEVCLDEAVLGAEARAFLEKRGKRNLREVKKFPGTLIYVVPASAVGEARVLFEPAMRRFLEKAVEKTKRVSLRVHDDGVVEGFEKILGRKLPRPRRSTGAVVDWNAIQSSFSAFRSSSTETFLVRLRQKRAGQIRILAADPTKLSEEEFNRQIWVLEAGTRIGERDISQEVLRRGEMTEELAREATRALEENRVELHGNYLWGSTSDSFGMGWTDNEDRVALLRTALEVLNHPSLSPIQKAEKLQTIKGFGETISTGLVMLWHPESFSMVSAISRSALEGLGQPVEPLDVFQKTCSELRQRLGVSDAIELHCFLESLEREDEEEPEDELPSETPRRFVKIAPGPDGQFWRDCLANNYMCIGWDDVGDMRGYSDRAEFVNRFQSFYLNKDKKNRGDTTRSAKDLWSLRELRVGDVVIANRGKTEILAVGEVVAPGYEFRPERESYKHCIHVKWDVSKARRVVPQDRWFRTMIELSQDEYRALMGESAPTDAAVLAKQEKAEWQLPPLSKITEAIAADGLDLDDRTIRRYHVALQVRGFVILAGISGTGKTWLTHAYANAIGAVHELVSVAPNWTTNEDLLGYFNPLGADGGRFHDTPTSRFLRQAAEEYRSAQLAGRRARPFHLVLDEMNLARVEHYFAKFLSALEVRQREKTAFIELHANDTIELGPNLFFIGTVNVDETTHGFSDKVYDRAQLLELPAPRALLEKHLGDVPITPLLMQLWDAVADVAPFAFRVLDDINAYVEKSKEYAPWQDALDEQVLQKVLPKLKGTDPRVGQALERIVSIAEHSLPLTHERARRMLEGFRQHGFASFF